MESYTHIKPNPISFLTFAPYERRLINFYNSHLMLVIGLWGKQDAKNIKKLAQDYHYKSSQNVEM